MSYKQVKYYQELEDYQTAYNIAMADWKDNPTLKWPKNTIAWMLILLMKSHAKAYAQKRFLAELTEFRELGIPLEDKKLWGAVAWPIRDIVRDSIDMQWFTPEFGDELFIVIKDIPFDKPSESYSAMAKSFIQLSGLWSRLSEFIEWWGFDSFNSFDYRRYPENGSLESLVEKVMTAYLVSLYRGGDGKQPSEDFFKALDNLAMRSKEQADKIHKIMKFE